MHLANAERDEAAPESTSDRSNTTRRLVDGLYQRFPTEKAALEYLERLRWPDGVRCPRCRRTRRRRRKHGRRPLLVYNLAGNPSRRIRPGLHYCTWCERQFTVATGTILEGSRVPKRTWLAAWHLACKLPGGVRVTQLQGALGLGSLHTASRMVSLMRRVLNATLLTSRTPIELTPDGRRQSRALLVPVDLDVALRSVLLGPELGTDRQTPLYAR